MSETLDGREWHIADVLPGEYPRLVRLCQRLVHDRSAAEELAQETLVEAWRHADKLHTARS